MKTIKIQSKQREEMIEITREVENYLRESNQKEGICVLFTQYTTCGLTINENADPDVKHDFLLFLKNTIPQFYEKFRHAEENSDAHLKSSLMGVSVTIPFANGKLLLGRWQGIYLCEFDGARGTDNFDDDSLNLAFNTTLCRMSDIKLLLICRN